MFLFIWQDRNLEHGDIYEKGQEKKNDIFFQVELREGHWDTRNSQLKLEFGKIQLYLQW